MKYFIYFITAVITLCVPLIAQDKENDDEENDRPSRSYWNRAKLGGAGGVTPIVGMFDNKEIDTYLKSTGLPVLGSDPMYLIGGEGYGYIMFLRNVRMGGFGATGNKSVSVVSVDTLGRNLKKSVDYEVSYGGFLMDYVQPVAYRLDIAFGASIGAGEINVTMRRDDGKFKDWNNLWNEFGNPYVQSTNYTRRLNGTFVVFNPHVNIEYAILSWLQLRVGAGYPMMFSPEWKLDDNYEINSVPAKIKTNGYTINAGIMFGFFGW
jgi:hypothetical protein